MCFNSSNSYDVLSLVFIILCIDLVSGLQMRHSVANDHCNYSILALLRFSIDTLQFLKSFNDKSITMNLKR